MKLELFIKSVLLVMSLNFELRSFDNIGMYKKNHKRSLDTLKIAAAYSQKTSCPFNNNIVCNRASKYRSFDGTCNNLNYPLYGSINTPYQRFLPAEYADGTDLPRAKSVNGNPLPSPRVLSTTLFSKPTLNEDDWRMIYVLFGQFVAHDLSQRSLSSGMIMKLIFLVFFRPMLIRF